MTDKEIIIDHVREDLRDDVKIFIEKCTESEINDIIELGDSVKCLEIERLMSVMKTDGRADVNDFPSWELQPMLNKIATWFPIEDLEAIEGFDAAILGIDETSSRLIYSVSKCIEILKEYVEEDYVDDFFTNNIKTIYMGDKTPIWCLDNL